mgnify:CR=1 FL=1
MRDTLVKLGKVFQEDESFLQANPQVSKAFVLWKNAWQLAEIKNKWFTQEFIQKAVQDWGLALAEEKVDAWLERYTPSKSPKTVALITAGNLPLVGLHDLLSILASGHKALVKPAKDDQELMENVMALLMVVNPSLKDRLILAKGKMSDFEAVIATGSDNSTRYFESYFGEFPHIFRGNRTSLAVLTGEESEEEMSGLADDVFQYFGMGCRNVSKVFVPSGYDPNQLLNAFRKYEHLADHNKFHNNYLYHKSIFGMNLDRFHDFGILLLRKVPELHAGIATLHYEEYESLEAVNKQIEIIKEDLQCVAKAHPEKEYEVKLGETQRPQLWDYADGVDTMKFLTQL